MEKRLNNPQEGTHDQPPQDETTKNKIDKHLSDINDTISEQDIKNINTGTGAAIPADNTHHVEEADEIMNEKNNDAEKPEKEAPSAWEILDNN